MSEYLFVYGTLRRGQPLYKYLSSPDTRFVGEGEITGRLFDLGKYPGATPDPKRFSKVRGEVHELLAPEPTLAMLDEVEGFDPSGPERSLFERRRTQVRLEAGTELTAWVYFYRRPLLNATEIPDGDYARYVTE